MSEFTEEEKKKLKLPKDVPLVELNGEVLINLDSPVFPRKVQKFFPFSQMMNNKQSQHFTKVLEELKKRAPIGQNIIPFDIFIIDIAGFKPKKENEDDCESE